VSKETFLDFKFFKIPLPKWSKLVFGILAIIFLTTVGVFWTKDKFFPQKDKQIAFQLEMFQNHFGETPLKKVEIFNNEKGSLEVLYYISDGALSAIRKSPDARIKPSIFWIPNLDKISIPEPPKSPPFLNITEDGTTVGLAFAGGIGNCLSFQEHSKQPYKTKVSDCQKNGWCKLWIWWEDGCKGYFWVFPYYGGYYWDTDKKGNPIFHWAMCVH